jgi:hypothetical protein
MKSTRISRDNWYHSAASGARSETVSYFILTVLGFSFWFYMAVPFASHRETYSWLATISSHDFSYAFANSMSVTYRPLSQATTWLAYLILDPSKFPTNILRQSLLQLFVYGMFVLGWWLVYRSTAERRALALVAFVSGGVFFSGYVHLFHIYGIMYVPVMLTVGALLGSHAGDTFERREGWFSLLAILLAFWHPFATALFVGFYFGFYIETFTERTKIQHLQALTILFVATMLSAGFGVLFARKDAAAMSLHTRLLGFLISYQTNEINRVASTVAFLLTLIVISNMNLSRWLKVAASFIVAAVSLIFLFKSLPLLFLWITVVLIKLFHAQSWSVFFLLLAAALLPFGGGIGTPMFALFAIVVAVYGTVLGSSQPEKALSFIKPRYVMGTTVAFLTVVLLVRSGVKVPIVTRVASPLLTERERTYQLETVLAWLHNSEYCRYSVAFAANAGSPIDSIDNVITRRNRPPADLDDVTKFWNTVLSCRSSDRTNDKRATALVTFGEAGAPNLIQVFKVEGRYAGAAEVWISDESRGQECPTCKAGDSIQSSLSHVEMMGIEAHHPRTHGQPVTVGSQESIRFSSALRAK